MEMRFQVGGNVSFGFHVGGGSAPQPPEPPAPVDGLAYLYGDMACLFDGTVMDFNADNIVYGTMVPVDYLPAHGFAAIIDRTNGSCGI